MSNVVSYEQARSLGLSSSFLRTVARSLDRIAREYFRRSNDGDFNPRYPGDLKETRSSLVEAGKINQQNSYKLRNLAIRLKKEGR